jgi:hypothetical protein
MSYSVTEKPTAKPIAYTCPMCESEEVEMQCWCRWDTDEQQWVFVEPTGNEEFFCNGCKDNPEDVDQVTLPPVGDRHDEK